MKESDTPETETPRGETTMTTATMTARQYVSDYSGFFDGTAPTHNDVDGYFTEAAFCQMFGDAELPENLTFAALNEAAHDLIDSRRA